MLAVPGCEQQETASQTLPPMTAETARSDWRWDESSARIAVASEDSELAAAIERARSSALDARRRWVAAAAQDRVNWAVKWAAPTTAGSVEHVWVEPLAWSRFRIEGRLLSPPQSPLECGRTRGELVSFAAEELSDWVYLAEGRIDGRLDGGFTIKLLEDRHGRP